MDVVYIKKVFTKLVLFNLVAVFLLSIFLTPKLSSMAAEQKTIFKNGILYYDVCGAATAEQAVEDFSKASSATFPTALDEESMAVAINKYIKKANPDSLMKGLGETIVAGAKKSNISPFIIVAIAQKESGIGDPGYGDGFNVRNANNSFGRSATASQPNVQGGDRLWYKWSSIKASVDHMAPENKGANGGGDIASYIREQYGDKIDGNNLVDFMHEYAPDFENDTTAYINDVRKWTDQMIRLTEKAGGGAAAQKPKPSEKKTVYMLGDSITVGAKDRLESEFKKNGANDVKINASESRSITGAGRTPGFNTNGLDAITRDKIFVAKADTIVIALGTNQETGFEQSMRNLVKKIRKDPDIKNTSADIYWVNIFSKGGESGYGRIDANIINDSIKKVADDIELAVIDTTKANIPLSDSVHPKIPGGAQKFAEVVVNGAFDGAPSSPDKPASVNGGCECKAGAKFSSFDGSNNAQIIYNFYVGEGYTPEQAAGFVGNYYQESKLDPTIVNGIGAFGIAQWLGGRKTNLQTFADEKGKTASHIELQLEFSIHELDGDEGAAKSAIKAVGGSGVSAVENVTVVIRKMYERPGEAEANDAARIQKALEIYEKYGDSPISSVAAGVPGDDGCVAGTVVGSFAAIKYGSKSELIQRILSEKMIVFGNYGPASSQKSDVESCLSETTLVGLLAMAEQSGSKIPINALASDHGGCGGGGSLHNSGRAIDIGYYGNGDPKNTPEGNRLYSYLYSNRKALRIDELIWKEPVRGTKCVDKMNPTDCYATYGGVMGDHYHHIHVGFME